MRNRPVGDGAGGIARFTNFCDSGTSKGTAFASFVGAREAARVTGLGLLVWDDGLIFCSHEWGDGHAGDTWFEMPRIHQSMIKRKPSEIVARANDLCELSAHGAVCARSLTNGVHRLRGMPVAWKKQLPKPMHHRKAWFDVLDATERELIGSTFHKPGVVVAQYILDACETYARKREVSGYSAMVTDLLDSVCMGLHHHGRLVL